MSSETAERRRLDDTHAGLAAWKKWGPYLSERQWGTVREDYSEGGNAWDYFTHDQAPPRVEMFRVRCETLLERASSQSVRFCQVMSGFSEVAFLADSCAG